MLLAILVQCLDMLDDLRSDLCHCTPYMETCRNPQFITSTMKFDDKRRRELPPTAQSNESIYSLDISHKSPIETRLDMSNARPHFNSSPPSYIYGNSEKTFSRAG